MMRVLVTAASKYGATAEIAAVLDKHGLEATVLPPEQVKGVDGYDAVVAGSAVYAGHWLKPTRELVERHAGALAGRPVWLFSSGPVGDPPKPEEDPVDVADLLAATGPAAPPSSGRGPRTWPGTRPPMLRPAVPDGQRRRHTSGLGTRRGRDRYCSWSVASSRV
jgi:Flavodoxin domain